MLTIAPLKLKKCNHKKLSLLAFVLATFSVTATAANNSPMKVSIGSEYESGWHQVVKYMYIQSTVNDLVIQQIVMNRGNCTVQTIPAYFSGDPMPLRFGEKLKVILNMGGSVLCEPIETEIKTNYGTFSW